MYVDDHHGEIIVFGFGWPTDASKTIYDAIDALCRHVPCRAGLKLPVGLRPHPRATTQASTRQPRASGDVV
jgi:hypothetical protein